MFLFFKHNDVSSHVCYGAFSSLSTVEQNKTLCSDDACLMHSDVPFTMICDAFL